MEENFLKIHFNSIPIIFSHFSFISDIVKVQIFVADINDNAPFFEQTRYEARVAENSEINEDVITVRAYDLDRREFSQLKISIYRYM